MRRRARAVLSFGLSVLMAVGTVPAQALAEAIEEVEAARNDASANGDDSAADARAIGEEVPANEIPVEDISAEQGGADSVTEDTPEEVGANEADGEITPDVPKVDEAPVTQSEIIANGKCGTCAWVLDSDGLLTIGAGELPTESYVSWPWSDRCSDIRTVVFDGNVVAGQSLSYLFYGCGSLANIDFGGLDTRGVQDMSAMFYACPSLTALDLSQLDAGNVTDMGCMFTGCSSLVTLTLPSAQSGKLAKMQAAFANCSALEELDLTPLVTSNVTNMTSVFSGCSSLRALNLQAFDTSSATDLGGTVLRLLFARGHRPLGL